MHDGVAPAAPRSPGETRAACAFTFDMDAETLWMARDIHKPVAQSQGRFGPVEALPRILALLEKAEIPASFLIPAWVASHYADAVRAIAAAGHEIGCHGDEHERVSGLEPKQEEAILKKSIETLTPLAGRRPVGQSIRRTHAARQIAEKGTVWLRSVHPGGTNPAIPTTPARSRPYAAVADHS